MNKGKCVCPMCRMCGKNTCGNDPLVPYFLNRGKACNSLILKLVGERGFEPPTPWSRTRCSTRLSHSPNLNGWSTSAGAAWRVCSRMHCDQCSRTVMPAASAPRHCRPANSAFAIVCLVSRNHCAQTWHGPRAGPARVVNRSCPILPSIPRAARPPPAQTVSGPPAASQSPQCADAAPIQTSVPARLCPADIRNSLCDC